MPRQYTKLCKNWLTRLRRRGWQVSQTASLVRVDLGEHGFERFGELCNAQRFIDYYVHAQKFRHVLPDQVRVQRKQYDARLWEQFSYRSGGASAVL